MNVCSDCGSRPSWWFNDVNDYCRRCAEKNGHAYLSAREVDPDLVKAWFFARDALANEAKAEEMAREFLEACEGR